MSGAPFGTLLPLSAIISQHPWSVHTITAPIFHMRIPRLRKIHWLFLWSSWNCLILSKSKLWDAGELRQLELDQIHTSSHISAKSESKPGVLELEWGSIDFQCSQVSNSKLWASAHKILQPGPGPLLGFGPPAAGSCPWMVDKDHHQ